MSRVLRDDIAVIDTNIVRILSVQGDEEARAYYRDALAGRLLRVSFMTVHEVYFGMADDKVGDRRRKELREDLRKYRVVHSTDSLIEASVELRILCKPRPISWQDLLIASAAYVLGCPFATDDGRLARQLASLGVMNVISRHLDD